MKESLESARNIHQILLVVLTVIGIFAVSIIFETNPYDAGLKMIADAESKVNSAIINKKLGIKHDSTGIRIYRQAEIDSSNKFVSRRDTSKIVKMRADMKRQEKDYNIALKTQNRNLRRLKVVLDSAEKNVDFKQFRDAYELL
jgi:spore cortex formation protein SpoVR/YcgB (stage V sporulation)